MPTLIEDALTSKLANWLNANRPEAIPSTVPIHVANRDELRSRPCIVLATSDSKAVSGLPNTARLKLDLHLFSQLDDTPAETHATWASELMAPVSGTVVFGVCCASQVVLEVWGEIETLNDGYDWLEVRLNGVREFYHESTSTTEDPWDSIAVGPFTVTLNLADRACGHIIEIDGSTGDEIANDNVWWRAKLVSIS